MTPLEEPHTMPDTELPIYRYRYIGTQTVVFPALTGYGIGELAPAVDGDDPDVIEVPVLLEHPDLEPADDETAAALAPVVEDDVEADVMPPASTDVDVDEVPDGTRDEVLAWVHDAGPDHVAARAATALGKENAAEEPRVTVVEALTRLANTEEH